MLAQPTATPWALARAVVVVGQLEPGKHEQVVAVGARVGLGLDRRQVLAVVSGVDVIVRRAGLRTTWSVTQRTSNPALP